MKSQPGACEDQCRLVAALRDARCFDHPAPSVEHLETHISHVLLAGEYAYKIKKPLDLGFLDFSTLERRRHFCAEELRLNGRLAPRIYLRVVPITGTPDRPRVDGPGEPIEYAVQMRRFPQASLLSGRKLDAGTIDRIAGIVAEFHHRIPQAPPDSEYGSPGAVLGPMLEDFVQIRRVLREPDELKRLGALEVWTRLHHSSLLPLLADRRQEGRIRECHGDMHLNNIALLDGEILIFDGIEFNPSLRWIDTMSELAFLLMDLQHRGEPALARRLLDAYLQRTGDFSGLGVLSLYLVYRAMVRAKVSAIRMAQSDGGSSERAAALAEHRSYLTLAESFARPRRPVVVITHGVSGSGKSSLTQALLERLPAVRIRSDVERKRLFGLAAESRTSSDAADDIYSAKATQATYEHLLRIAARILAAGESVIVDATFLKHGQRETFRRLAEERRLPFLILYTTAPEALLRARVEARYRSARDPSEADPGVLAAQLAAREPLRDDERRFALRIDTATPISGAEVLKRCRRRLAGGL